MFDHPDGPSIPERTSVRTSLTPKDKEHKRRSLPAADSKNYASRRSSNRVVIQPASTEVISNLIDTLSAISTPVRSHFDDLPDVTASQSTPVSPSPWHTQFPRTTQPEDSAYGSNQTPSRKTRLGMDDRKHYSPTYLHSNYLRRPEHASTASKRSSAASKRISSEKSYQRTSTDVGYDDTLDEHYSFGTPSIEPWDSSTSLGSKEPDIVKKVRSVRSLRSLGFKSSKDSLRQPDAPRHRALKRERLIIRDSRSPSPSGETLEVRKARPAVAALEIPDRSASQREHHNRLYWTSEDVHGGTNGIVKNLHNIPDEAFIPKRDSSSRRISGISSNHSNRASKSNNAEPNIQQESLTTPMLNESFHTPPETPSASVDPDEDSVARRIRELKEQKTQRDRLSAQSASNELAPPKDRTRTPSPSPLAVSHQPANVERPTEQTLSLKTNLDDSNPGGEGEETAPSPPAISQRLDRINLHQASPASSKRTSTKHSPTTSRDDTRRASVSLPQRSNSRLLKRLSQHAGPMANEGHRRRFSNPLGNSSPVTHTIVDTGDPVGDAIEKYLSSPRLSQKIQHPHTGRVISFSEVGDPNGSVVFVCVGMGLTRFVTAFYDELATTLRLRLITPDRPGVGASEAYADGLDTPLGWPDDVRSICEHRGISKFSILAHSAGAIYALATALRMPQHMRCRVHLLAPWIPPSQMSAMGTHQDPLPANALPYSQRFLRSLPTTFLRAANSSFLSVTSNKITTSLPRSPNRTKRKPSGRNATPPPGDLHGANMEEGMDAVPAPQSRQQRQDGEMTNENLKPPPPIRRGSSAFVGIAAEAHPVDKDRQSSYEARLAESIWDAATTGANSAVDLIVCLERRQPIGFRYVDITRTVVIHHGSKDNRVPVENVKWLGKMMKRCEVRVLEGESHGLMANAGVMGNILMEIAQEWEDWNRVVKGKGGVHGGGERRVINGV